MTSSPWAWLALLGGAIVVAAVGICYAREDRPAPDPLAGVAVPRRALVMQ